MKFAMGPLVRCHVAIRLPQSIFPKIQETQMNIRRKSSTDVSRWNSPDEMVLTLCALGEQGWDRVKQSVALIGPICARYPAMHLKLEGVMGLPNNNQPRFVAAGVAGDTERLLLFREELARALAPLIPPSEKAYVPHVLLGRLRVESEQARTALGRAVRMMSAESFGEWVADSVELIRADAGASGIQYVTVERFSFAAAEPAPA